VISLSTGLPGHGKTLCTIERVERLRLETGRPVFYKRKDPDIINDYGIEGLSLPWQPLEDVAKWFDAPAGAIIVIDECQRLFEKRPQSSKVPAYVSRLETHRHSGFDLFLITQDAKNLDAHARRLVEEHHHYQRLYGTQRVKIYKWQHVQDPSRPADRNMAQTVTAAYNPKFFGVYKSAEVHTVKARLPWKWIAVVVFAFIIMPAVAFGVFRWFGASVEETVATDTGAVEGSSSSELPTMRPAVATWSPESLVPRVNAWPWSAPFYDKDAPQRNAPRITGCLSMRVGHEHICKCSNGQGDAQVTLQQCRDYLAGKHYDPARPYVDVKAENIQRLESATGDVQQIASGDSQGVTRAPSAF
jgi:hypothetical protein